MSLQRAYPPEIALVIGSVSSVLPDGALKKYILSLGLIVVYSYKKWVLKEKNLYKISIIHFKIILIRGVAMRKMIDEIKEMIASGLDLGGADLSNFGESDPIFGEQGLDSIDAMELIMLLKKKYGITVENMQQGRTIFKDFGTLAEYVEKNRQK